MGRRGRRGKEENMRVETGGWRREKDGRGEEGKKDEKEERGRMRKK